MELDWFAPRLYADVPADKDSRLLAVLMQQMRDGASVSRAFRAFLDAQPRKLDHVRLLEDLPFLPVSVFKRSEPLCFLPGDAIYRVLESSATSGQQPSRIAIDRSTAKLMSRGVTSIISDFIGTHRRPYLIIDRAPANDRQSAANARTAAIQGLMGFATEICYALRPAKSGEEADADSDGSVFDVAAVEAFCRKHHASDIVAYGFTYVVYLHLGGGLTSSRMALEALQARLGQALLPRARILHSGGWKKLLHLSVDKDIFNQRVGAAMGTPASSVIDYYGMVEQLGVVYPDCPAGNKHAPRFAQVVLRKPLDWSACKEGEVGLIQVLSVLSPSFPGQSLLTEDLGLMVHEDGCSCGRRGIAFRFAGRVPKAEVRGCSDVQYRRPS